MQRKLYSSEISNYEKCCEDWRQRFLTMDQDALMQKLPELNPEGDQLTIFHFNRKYAIHRKTGRITTAEGHQPISHMAQLNIYTLLWFSSPQAFLMNHFIPFRELRGAAPFAPAFQKSVLDTLASTFAGKADLLRQAAKKLGGTWLAHGDVAFQLSAFNCIPIQVYFWDSDAEFHAQANILFDYSAVDFIHIESVVSIAAEGISRLAEAVGLSVKGSHFG